MNRAAEYERQLSGSYMKIQIENENTLDERMILKNRPKGILSMEKCFFNGKAEYWYQISGKQSLESYCGFHEIGIAFVEKVVVSVCSQVAIMEKNMLSPNGLLLQPEYLFVDNRTQEIIFTFYPCDTVDLSLQFQRLMEYLLTKINHKDADAVSMAYELYEMTLEDGYSIWDIQESIAKSRASRKTGDETPLLEKNSESKGAERQESIGKNSYEEPNGTIRPKSKQSIWQTALKNEMLKEWNAVFLEENEKIKTTFNKLKTRKNGNIEDKKKKKERKGTGRHAQEALRKQVKEQVIYPSEFESVQDDVPLHPTICLSDYREHPDGLLLYEGYEDFKDIRLEKKSVIIGKGESADIRINKETISHVHAKLSYENEEYYLEDLNSTNGCMVNGKLLNYHERQKLCCNDILCFADVKYRFI